MVLSSVNTTLIFSGVYPLLSLLFAAFMIFIYVKAKAKGKKPVKALAVIPAAGLVYGIIYSVVYCVITLNQGGFAPIFVIRSFEGFAIDLAVWIVLAIHSSITSSQPKTLSEEDRIHISNL